MASEELTVRAAQEPSSQSKSQQAYHWIKGRIANQSFTPGYRLVLGSIANELDMSVVPVREAIRQLEAEGLVTFERNVGAHVSMVDDSQYRHSMQALSILEGAATALSARRLTVDDVRRARTVNELMVEILDHFDPHSFTALNQEFHAILFERCANPRCSRSCAREWGRLGQSPRLDLQLRPRPRRRVGARAREHPAAHRDERPARRHRDGRPPPSLGDPRRLPDPRAPRRGPRPPQLLIHPRRVMTDTATATDGAPRARGPAHPHPALHRRRVRRQCRRRHVRRARPGDERDLPAGRGRQEGRHRPRRRRRPPRLHRRSLAPDAAPRALARAAPHRRHRRVARRAARRARELRLGPADHAGARSGAARRRELPLLRRPDRRAGRRRLQGARASS